MQDADQRKLLPQAIQKHPTRRAKLKAHLALPLIFRKRFHRSSFIKERVTKHCREGEFKYHQDKKPVKSLCLFLGWCPPLSSCMERTERCMSQKGQLSSTKLLVTQCFYAVAAENQGTNVATEQRKQRLQVNSVSFKERCTLALDTASWWCTLRRDYPPSEQIVFILGQKPADIYNKWSKILEFQDSERREPESQNSEWD
ncbi:Hypothetical predicted protein [Podarcis lilfordi]|uniref:Uncharacterized protein n=1 Tax=Podarcis lilfordi TaxID=74358 RepID=A0AA35L434_9SAUR|nr:Hypothetical predicted protein [Podarcis lilfordi]